LWSHIWSHSSHTCHITWKYLQHVIFLYDEDKDTRHIKTCLSWYPLLALGSSFSHHPWPWNGIAYCELPSEPSVVVISVIQSLRASLKRGTRVLAACKYITANQSKPEGRSHLGQQQQQFSTIEWTWDVVWNVVVAISECAQTSGRRCCCLRGWCALRVYPWHPIIWQNAFYDEPYTLSVNN